MSEGPGSGLYAVSSALLAMSRHLEVRDVLKTIVASARELLGAQYAALGVPDDHGGFAQFAVAGHDRGGRVACRMALDHRQAVTRLALLDIVPTRTVYTQVSKNLATWYFHWFFLIQPAPLPEMLLAGQTEPFLRNFAFRGLIPDAIDEPVFAEYLRCFADPHTLHAMCEDYRAGASIDLQHDEADLATTLGCPTLVLWGVHGAMHRLFDVLETWRPRAPEAHGKALPAGHWLPEECPQEVAATLRDFLA